MASFALKKQKALQYYQTNGVPKKMEEVLNLMFNDKPSDTFGYLSNYFEGFATFPFISKIKTGERYDSKGMPALHIQLFCIVKNKESLIGDVVVPIQSSSCEQAKGDDTESEESQRNKLIDEAKELVESVLSGKLKGYDPRSQIEIDNLMCDHLMQSKDEDPQPNTAAAESGAAEDEETKNKGKKSGKGSGKKKGAAVVVIPDEPKEMLPTGFCAISGVSEAVASATARAKNVDVFQHIESLTLDNSQYLTIPTPMITMLVNGKGTLGKSNCVKEFMIVPSPQMSLETTFQNVDKVYQTLLKTITNKGGIIAKNVTDNGSLTFPIDRAEQGLEMVQEALTQCELKPGEDFYIVLNCSAAEYFDYDKGKYEVVQGTVKAASEMVDFWKDLITRFPAVIGLIDPIRKEEKESWMALCEAVSDKCFIIGDAAYHRPGVLKNETLPDDFGTNAVIFKLAEMTTVSDLVSCSEKMRQHKNEIIIATGLNDTCDCFSVDLAVGLRARFVKFGSMARGERTAKYNRLLDIECILKDLDRLGEPVSYTFNHIQMPEPKEEGEIISALPTPDTEALNA